MKINLDVSIFNHPKIRRLRTYCGPNAEIYIVRLWCYAAEFHPKDGRFKGYSPQEIEGLAGYTEAAGNLVFALKTLGLLDEEKDKTLKIHDWFDHAGFIWKYKRAGIIAGEKSGLSRRLSNQSVQRFRHNRSTMELNGMELNKGKDLGSEAMPHEPPFLAFKTNGKTKEWHLVKSRLLKLKELYPGVDVEMECRRAADWCDREPLKRKTASGMERFLNTWLSKEQNNLRDKKSEKGGTATWQEKMLDQIQLKTSSQ